jgi:ribonuclease Z
VIRVTFLGTAASRPTVGRNVSSVVVQRLGEQLMFDCGEGTQRQMMRYGTGFGIHDIFLTHMHADHFLGLPGLLRTMGLQGREETLRVYCARGQSRLVDQAVHLGVERVPFEVEDPRGRARGDPSAGTATMSSRSPRAMGGARWATP